MEKFTRLEAVAASIAQPNVDTDVIIRVERCARVPRAELGRWAFEALRYRADGSENPDFVLNREPWRRARILVCGENFGCGSSREMAVWAIAAMGIRCLIAPSFGDIFSNNCFQNGVLAVRLDRATVARLHALAADPATATMTVDLGRSTIRTASGEEIAFEVAPLERRALLEGLDPIGLTLTLEERIAAFEARDRARRPWVYFAGPAT
ncbi:MAG: 3-isopropylmalate dehydratase small subunit [Pseudomonadota bacterium]